MFLPVQKEDVVEKIAMVQQDADGELADGEMADGEMADDELADAEMTDDESDATVGEVFADPAVVSVNPQGELVGNVSATVNGDLTPIEAKITLVSGGVLLGKTVALEDGSFSFPNIAPGNYQIFGCAASYCGQRSCNVVSTGDCCDVVNVRLDQQSVCGCDGGFANAPAASFNNGVGGFVDSGISYGNPAYSSGGGGFGGGGFGGGGFGGGGAAGGGRLIGTRAFRLLAIGGIATAIAVGASDDDDVSPSE